MKATLSYVGVGIDGRAIEPLLPLVGASVEALQAGFKTRALIAFHARDERFNYGQHTFLCLNFFRYIHPSREALLAKLAPAGELFLDHNGRKHRYCPPRIESLEGWFERALGEHMHDTRAPEPAASAILC